MTTETSTPSLFRPIPCPECDGHGGRPDGHPNDPDTRLISCDNCDGTGEVPYPGTPEAQLSDFLTEVIEPIQALLQQLDQRITIFYRHDNCPNVARFSFAIGDHKQQLVWDNDLSVTAEKAWDNLVNGDERQRRQAEIDAQVEHFRRTLESSAGL